MFQSPIRDLTQGLGFTLIELMLALGLLLVLGLIARPTYQEYVERGYQLQAQADLLACAQRLHRVALQRNSYSGHADTNGDGMGDADTGLVAASVCPHVRSESSQYVVTIRSVADEFELIATPREERLIRTNCQWTGSTFWASLPSRARRRHRHPLAIHAQPTSLASPRPSRR